MKIILHTALVAALVQSQLPIWLDYDKEPFFSSTPSKYLPKNPPPAKFRVPAEYESVMAVVIAQIQFPQLMTGIMKAVLNYGNASIWSVGGQAPLGTDPEKFQIQAIQVDGVWTRDYGPVGVDLSDNTIGFVDTTYRHFRQRPRDDAFPETLAKIHSYPVFKAPLILDGGNFMVDSFGNLFVTKRVYLWNPDLKIETVDSLLKEYFGVATVNSIEYAGYPNNV
jgi:Porphyromonas-type peptidyl-arginine deiminase